MIKICPRLPMEKIYIPSWTLLLIYYAWNVHVHPYLLLENFSQLTIINLIFEGEIPYFISVKKGGKKGINVVIESDKAKSFIVSKKNNFAVKNTSRWGGCMGKEMKA